MLLKMLITLHLLLGWFIFGVSALHTSFAIVH